MKNYEIINENDSKLSKYSKYKLLQTTFKKTSANAEFMSNITKLKKIIIEKN